MSENKLILVTGATGYVGGHLVPLLLEEGYRVRCLVRVPERLSYKDWYRDVEIVAGDLVTGENLAAALQGVSSAYYLVHNMSSGSGYIELDLAAARNFAQGAQQAGVEHIIYLGGLADPAEKIAAHMRSRIETGEMLRSGSVPVTEFRAGVVIGPGSISFEMIRFLAEHFPILVGPGWLRNRSQPIAIRDVLDYLLAALENRNCQGQIFEIGGADVLTYAETMLAYARSRGLERKLLVIPYLPVWLMARVVGWLTPVPASIAYPLIEGLYSNSIVKKDDARKVFPKIRPMAYGFALDVSLDQLNPSSLDPVWLGEKRSNIQLKHEGFFVVHHRRQVRAPVEEVFRVLTGLGGKRGWLSYNRLWRLRGWLDRLAGGPGMRGRYHPDHLQVGDVVDFYRVETIQPAQRLCLHAELRVPGEGWMDWQILQDEDGAILYQTACFVPYGTIGCLYWYTLGLFHGLVFRGLIEKVAQKAEQAHH